MTTYEIHHAEEWSAVYMDGKLVSGPGDSYLQHEWLLEHFGVEQVQDDAFMRGQNRAEGAAQTIDEVEAYRLDRDAALMKADRLRREAAALVAKAADLESEWR